MSFLAMLPALMPVIIQIAMEIFNQEKENPAGGQGSKKKKNVIESVINFISNSNLIGKLIGNNENPTVKFAEGFIDLFVGWLNDTGVFRKTVDIDTTPTGGAE